MTPQPTPLIAGELAELEEKYAATTQGKWCEFAGSLTLEEDGHIAEELAQFCGPNRRNNGEFIAATHNAWPAIRATIAALEEKAAGSKREGAIKALEEVARQAEAGGARGICLVLRQQAARLRKGLK